MAETFFIQTFGCQMNKLDSELLHAVLVNEGLCPADGPSGADVVIYNTCSVRRHAEDRVLSNLGRWRERAAADPGFILGVVGCMAQRMGGDIIEKFPFVRLVCGTGSFLQVPRYIAETSSTGVPVVDIGDRPPEPGRYSALRSGTSYHAYVSIMRGCSNFCTYCIVPYVRGAELSRPRRDIVNEVKRLSEANVAEVTLLGQNVCAYGRRGGGSEGAEGGLPRLLGEIGSMPGIKRIRFVTSHPADMTADILEAVAENEKVCEHIHMPVQSGSDRILRAMNRKYSREQYLETVERARSIISGVAFSSDFIAGFPGESDRDFEDTLSLLRTVKFQQSYIFRYSPRPGTGASELADDIPDEVKRLRQQQLLAAQRDVDLCRRNGLIGQTLEVMCTGENTGDAREGGLIGRTRQNDIIVFGNGCGEHVQAGDICPVKVEKATALTLFGCLE